MKIFGALALALFLLGYGCIELFQPREAWFLSNPWLHWRNNEPGRAGLVWVRARGVVSFGFGAVLLVFTLRALADAHLVYLSPGTTGAHARTLDHEIRDRARSTQLGTRDPDVARYAINQVSHALATERCRHDAAGPYTFSECMSDRKPDIIDISLARDYGATGRITVRPGEYSEPKAQTVCLTVQTKPSLRGPISMGACT
jgi:hypothetical protein